MKNHNNYFIYFMLVAAMVSSSAANATITSYQADLEFTSGALSGSSSVLYFSINDVTNVGSEVAVPSPLSTQLSLVSFNTEIDGLLWSMLHDDAYPNYPLVELFNGDVDTIDYVATQGNAQFDIFLDPDLAANSVWYMDAQGVVSGGVVSDAGRVSEPSAIALMGLGLLGFVATRRKNRK